LAPNPLITTSDKGQSHGNSRKKGKQSGSRGKLGVGGGGVIDKRFHAFNATARLVVVL